MAIHFAETEIKAGLKYRRALKAFLSQKIKTALPDLKKMQLYFIFLNDEALLQYNLNYLDHDTYTDIITFDLSEGKDTLVGEIYISVERIEENARSFEVSYDQELHRVIFHGVLHLLGYGDKSKSEIREMRQQEREWLHQYFSK